MKIASASSPIHDLSMLAAECTTPRRTMPGTVTPTGRVEAGKLSMIWPKTSATACGVAGRGVSIRIRSCAKSPTSRSTGAPLMPVPPKSMPKGCSMATNLSPAARGCDGGNTRRDAGAGARQLDKGMGLVNRVYTSYGHVNPTAGGHDEGRATPPDRHRGTVPDGSTEHWTDSKRYLWLIGLVVPSLAFVAFGCGALTGWGVWFWIGPIVILGVVPAIDLVAGLDRSNPPGRRDRGARAGPLLPLDHLPLPADPVRRLRRRDVADRAATTRRARDQPCRRSTGSAWRSRSAASAASASTPPTSSATRRRPTSAGCPRSRWPRASTATSTSSTTAATTSGSRPPRTRQRPAGRELLRVLAAHGRSARCGRRGAWRSGGSPAASSTRCGSTTTCSTPG